MSRLQAWAAATSKIAAIGASDADVIQVVIEAALPVRSSLFLATPALTPSQRAAYSSLCLVICPNGPSRSLLLRCMLLEAVSQSMEQAVAPPLILDALGAL